jgi:hypothetical protein
MDMSTFVRRVSQSAFVRDCNELNTCGAIGDGMTAMLGFTHAAAAKTCGASSFVTMILPPPSQVRRNEEHAVFRHIQNTQHDVYTN